MRTQSSGTRTFTIFAAAAGLAIALSGCASSSDSMQDPTGTAVPSDGLEAVVGGPTDTNGMPETGDPFAMWVSGNKQFTVTTYGSSSCLPIANEPQMGTGNSIEVSVREADSAMCTADLAPRTWTLDTPSGIDPSQSVTITLTNQNTAFPDIVLTLVP